MQKQLTIKCRLFIFLLLGVLLSPTVRSQPYQVQGQACVLADNFYGPYSIIGGPWSSSDKWCVSGGTIGGLGTACTNGNISPSIGVTWSFPASPGNGTGTVSFYRPASTLVATLNVTVINPGIATPGGQFVPSGLPVSFTVSAPDVITCSGGFVMYQWMMSTNGGSSYSIISGATSRDYNIVNQTFTQTTLFRRQVTVSNIGGAANSSPATVIPMPPPTPGSLSPSLQTISPNQTPAVLSVSAASGGSCGGNYNYFWESSTDNVNWTSVPGPPAMNYAPPPLTQTMYYRVRIGCGPLQMGVYTNTATVYVNLPLVPGAINPSSITIPYNTSTGAIPATPATGGSCFGSYAYQWQESSDAVNFTDIPGITTAGYTPPAAFTATKYYRRKVVCNGVTLYTNVYQVKVINATDNENYVRERVIKRGGVQDLFVAEGLSNLREVIQTTTYLDRLARPVQKVTRKGSFSTNVADPVSSAGANDVVDIVQYDNVGRKQFKYLPYSAAGNTGAYRVNALTEQNNFLQLQYIGQGESVFYGQVDYESSPLNRVVETFAPGNAWAGTAGQPSEASRRSIKLKYRVNTATDGVRQWSVTDPVSTGAFGTYSSPGEYAVGSLYKTITADEVGKQIIEFKDKSDKLILKKVQLTASADDGNGSNHTGWLCTYYIYDDLGNMRCIVTPRAVELISANWVLTDATILAEQCYRYEYDVRNRLIMKKSAGSGEVYIVYDSFDRLVMTQDANMRSASPQKWTVTLYDQFNRAIQTGLWNDANGLAYHLQQAGASSTDYPFSASSVPGAGYERLTRTGYDNFTAFPSGTGMSLSFDNTYINNSNYFFTTYSAAPNFAEPFVISNQTRGMVTWTETKVLNSSPATYLYSVNFYDVKGRLVQVKNKNSTGGTDILTTQFSWFDQPLIVMQKQEQVNSPNPTQTSIVLSKTTYDDMGRVVQIDKKIQHTQVNGNALPVTWTTIVKKEYDDLGQLKIKKLGDKKDPSTGNYTGVPLETMTYDYGIRGWILGMNRGYVAAPGQTTDGIHFGFELGYEKQANQSSRNFNNVQYNGNITGVVWKSDGDDVRRKYDFTYDAASRMMKADFEQQNPDNAQWNNSQLNYSVKMGDGASYTSAYDANGNIKGMTQYGYKPGGNPAAPIDQLTYNYMYNNTSNRLLNVIDGSNEPQTKLGDFRTSLLHPNQVKDANTVDYIYDANGNLVKDYNKDVLGWSGGDGITYNHLSLPYVVTIKKDGSSDKGTITYTYNATGNKIKKVVQENNTSVFYNGTNHTTNITTTITYAGVIVYESKVYSNPSLAALGYPEQLQFIVHEEGRTRFRSSDNTLQYDYYIRDHVGSVRMVLTEEVAPAAIYQATMEDANRANEEKLFTQIPQTESLKPGGFDNVAANQKVSKVFNASGNDKRVGPGVVLKVMAGDKFKALVNGWYLPGSTDNNALPGAPGIITSVLSAFTGGLPAGSKYSGGELSGSGVLTGPLTEFLNYQTGQTTATRPKAYLNWMILDEVQFKLVSGNYGAVQVPEITGVMEKQVMQAAGGTEIEVKKNGYLYVYVSNESQGNVYFDDLRVEFTRGALREEAHYYPGGLQMAAISSQALSDAYVYSRHKFQGQEFEGSMGLNMLEFEARQYDPQIARWVVPDPANQFGSPYLGMGNNWPNGMDPDGRVFGIDDILIGALIGAIISTVTYVGTVFLAGGGWSDITLKGLGRAAAMGALGGAIGAGFSGLTNSLGAFGNSVGYNIMSNVATSLAVDVAFGNDITLGGFIGAVAGGAIEGAIPQFKGFKHGKKYNFIDGVKNALGELTINSLRGGLIGGISGGLGAMINKQDVEQGFVQGFRSGAVGAGFRTALNITILGPAIRPAGQAKEALQAMEVAMDVKLINGIGTPTYRIGGLWGRGLCTGRSLLVGKDTESERGIDTWLHESYHYVQQLHQTWAGQARRGIKDQFFTRGDPYIIAGTNEYYADQFSTWLMKLFGFPRKTK